MATRELSLDDSMALPEPIEGVPEKSSRVPEKSRNAVRPGVETFPGFDEDEDENFAGYKGEDIADANEGLAENGIDFTGNGVDDDEPNFSETQHFADGKNGTLLEIAGNSTSGLRVGSSTEEGPDTKFAYATWFIVLMCIIIILIIILIIVCLIKRSRGGRYPVQKKEKEAGYDAERDGEAGLGGDFTRTEDDADLLHRSGGSQGSLNGSLKPLESDADSLAAYGDGEGGKFNEDGSFIGQYGPDKKRSNTEWQMI